MRFKTVPITIKRGDYNNFEKMIWDHASMNSDPIKIYIINGTGKWEKEDTEMVKLSFEFEIDWSDFHESE